MQWRQIILFLGMLGICFNISALEVKVKKNAMASVVLSKQKLFNEINNVVSTLDKNAQIGIYIKSMKHGDVLYTKNAYKLFIPASIVKIMTAQAALLYLGPEYKFPTSLATNDKNYQGFGPVNGDLYFVQTGDPTLTYTDLTDLMTTLKGLQLQNISGNVYIDNTAYDQVNTGPGWDEEDKQFCYAAPVNASIINRNCLAFKIAPAAKAGPKP